MCDLKKQYRNIWLVAFIAWLPLWLFAEWGWQAGKEDMAKYRVNVFIGEIE